MGKYPEYFYERLRRPSCGRSDPDWPPILFFGNHEAKVATVGRNPSPREYTQPPPNSTRFLTWSAISGTASDNRDEPMLDQLLDHMVGYFDEPETPLDWFDPLIRVLEGGGTSYQGGQVVHLDLIQEATDPVWSTFANRWPLMFAELLLQDVQFTRRLIDLSPIQLIFCNGESAYSTIKTFYLHDANDDIRSPPKSPVVKSGKIGSVRWIARKVDLGTNADVVLAGWNPQIQSNKYTGLDDDGERDLGAAIANAVHDLGVSVP